MENQKLRADELLVKKGLCQSRTAAKNLIQLGNVLVNNTVLNKPSKLLPIDVHIELTKLPQFVSRGGEKLNAFLETFNIPVTNKTVLDVGASTGGFTDCVLQRGAKSVTCIDVGHSQLHKKILEDQRVTNIEKVNARDLKPKQLPLDSYEMIVMDLSFISIRKVLKTIWQFLQPNGILITLVKPQFEVTQEIAKKTSGVIKDSAIHEHVLAEILGFFNNELEGSTLIGQIPSPIKGTDGNQEFLLGMKKSR